MGDALGSDVECPTVGTSVTGPGNCCLWFHPSCTAAMSNHGNGRRSPLPMRGHRGKEHRPNSLWLRLSPAFARGCGS